MVSIFQNLCCEKTAELSGFIRIVSLSRMQDSIVNAPEHWIIRIDVVEPVGVAEYSASFPLRFV